jgi:S-(hydroxymethyl)glutathione dehydrogenase/alcohol dehydrogenase
MKAAILHEVRAPLRIEDVEIEAPQAREVLVRMAASGVCHSDYHVITGDLPAAMPIALGHEGAGVVEAVGPDVTLVKPGDRVVLSFRPHCGYCRPCLSGRVYLCENVESLRGRPRLRREGRPVVSFLGVASFAEWALVHESAAIAVPNDVPLDRAALLGCAVLTGFGAVFHTARVEPGASVAVIGCGGVGLNVIQAASLANAGAIVAVDVHAPKLELARQFGATDTLNANDGDLVRNLKRLTDGGPDYAFEVVGRPEAIAQAFHAIRKGGMAVVVGVAPYDSRVELKAHHFIDEKRIVGTNYGSSRPRLDIPRLVSLYRAGRLRLDELVSRTYPLGAVNEAFADMIRGEVARGVIVLASHG